MVLSGMPCRCMSIANEVRMECVPICDDGIEVLHAVFAFLRAEIIWLFLIYLMFFVEVK